MDEDAKQSYEIPLPKTGEFQKEEKLAFEKEVLGIYISGHPLEEQEECWRKNISAVTTDFLPDEETGYPKVTDGQKVIIGGMITDKKIKYTKTNKTMAFLTIEDLLGTVEVVVFPRDYERNAALMQEEAKVFVQGRIDADEDRAAKLICERIYPFEDMPRELWIQFPDKETYEKEVAGLYGILADSDGNDQVVLYIRAQKAMKRLPPSRSVRINSQLLEILNEKYGAGNVKVVEKSIEKRR